MTPDDVDAIRDELRAEKCSLVRVPQLCDALEQAWAERDGTLKIAQANLADYREMRERAERAEAELAECRRRSHETIRINADLMAERDAALDAWHGMGDAWADLQAWADHESDRADRAEEAISNERQKVVNLTGELAVVNDHLADVVERAERAEKRCDELRPWAARWVREGQVAVEALARVRSLCDELEGQLGVNYAVLRVRAAIEGDNQ